MRLISKVWPYIWTTCLVITFWLSHHLRHVHLMSSFGYIYIYIFAMAYILPEKHCCAIIAVATSSIMHWLHHKGLWTNLGYYGATRQVGIINFKQFWLHWCGTYQEQCVNDKQLMRSEDEGNPKTCGKQGFFSTRCKWWTCNTRFVSHFFLTNIPSTLEEVRGLSLKVSAH